MGQSGAIEVLCRILSDEARPDPLLPFDRTVLIDIGDGHAERLMVDESGQRLDYWPKVWAARSLAYVGDDSAGEALVAAIGDDHWRVRMTAIQTIGRIGIGGASDQLVAALDDDHPRVRAAALLGLERVGDETALDRLSELLAADPADDVTQQAIARIVERS